MAEPNYYDLTQLTPKDPANVFDQLKLKKQAKISGRKNMPEMESKDYDDNEKRAIKYAQQLCYDYRHDTTKRILALNEDIKASKNELLSETFLMQQTNIYQSLKNELNEGARPLKRANKEYTDEKNLLERFKSLNKIKNSPPPRPPAIKKFAALLIYIVIESLANTYLFSHGQSLGLLGGLTIAIGVSAINVFACYFIGMYFLKYWNHVDLGKKLLGSIYWVISILALPLCHIFIAFYRQFSISSVSQENSSQITTKAFSALREMQFSILDLSSISLLMLGTAFGLMAIYKGFTEGHPYPGYERKYNKYLQFEKKLKYVERQFRIKYIRRADLIVKTLESRLSGQTRVRNQLESRIRRRSAINNRRKELPQELAVMTNQVLDMYRKSNIEFRSEAEPPYFKTLYVDQSIFEFKDEFSESDSYEDRKILSATNYDLQIKAKDLISQVYKTGDEMRDMLESSLNV